MKNILIPTDFSSTAAKALEYGIALAKQFNAKIHILNTYEVPHSGATLMVSIDDLLQKESLNHLSRLEAKLKTDHPDLNFDTHSEHGSLDTVVSRFCENHQLDLVVMGTTGASGFGGKLFGSNTASLIRNIKTPLIVIPEKSVAGNPKRIGISTDFKFEITNPIYDSVRKLALMFGSKLSFINVTTKFQERELEEIERQFGTDVDFIYGDNVEKGIKEYITERNVDLLVIVAEKHGIFHSIFKPSISKDLARELSIPMLILTQ